MKITTKKLSELRKPEKNVRIHTEQQLREFERSVKMFGQIRPIVIDENNVILAGNGLYDTLIRLEYEEAEVCQYFDLTENQKKKLMIADNKIFSLGIENLDTLNSFLEDLHDDLDIPGYDSEILKQMVSEVVMSVLSDNSNRHITIQAPAPEKGSKVSAKTEAADKPKKEPKKRTPRKSAAAGKKTEQASGAVAASSTEASVQADDFVGQPCPLCGKGTVIKGKTAYGCSEWKSGCTFRKPFE